MEAFMAFDRLAFEAGDLSVKVKELTALIVWSDEPP
jgi:hypothetical protein